MDSTDIEIIKDAHGKPIGYVEPHEHWSKQPGWLAVVYVEDEAITIGRFLDKDLAVRSLRAYRHRDGSIPVQYAWLFGHIANNLPKFIKSCDHTLRHAKAFAEEFELPFQHLEAVLNDLGGFCDCEVMLNVANEIDRDELISHETFPTATQFAVENDLYCHCTVDGEPFRFWDAVAAKECTECEHNVEFWVPCGKDDPFAEPDTNRAKRHMQNAPSEQQ